MRVVMMCMLCSLRHASMLVLVVACCSTFELQDTIHALIEENIHLHDQLENLTTALRQIRQLLFHHSNAPDQEHDASLKHLWEEWSQHTINPETHMLLVQALCGREPRSPASKTTDHTHTFLTLTTITLTHLLL